jgi:hypothetical protein
MAKLSKAIAVLAMFAAWYFPTQVASAAPALHHQADLTSSISHQEDGAEKIQEDSEDEKEGERDGGGKQFAPPPLVVKHKSMSGQYSDKNGKGEPKSSKFPGSIAGALPSSSDVLLKVAGLGVVSLEQVFAQPEYVTSSISGQPASSQNQSGATAEPESISSGSAVNPMLNEPVVKSISFANYEDPAGEFMHKAYFGLAALGAAAIAITVHTIANARKSADSDEDDYEYEAQN